MCRSAPAGGSRPLWAALGGLALALAVAAPARALIEGSPHDLISQGYDATKDSPQRERCRICHLPSTSAFQALPPSEPGVLSRTYDEASLICFSCHDGTTIVSPNVDATRTAFHPASHGTDLRERGDLKTDTTGLPHLGGDRMACTTCHEPHDNSQRPFLRAELQALCFRCHSRLAEYSRGKENRSGNHILAVDPAGAPREEAPLAVGEAFRTAYPSPYPLRGGREEGSWHWDLGGHLGSGALGGMGCATCHAVHGDEAAGPAAKLMTVEPVNESANFFCEGCHAGDRADGGSSPPRPNPGGTTTARTYHPADDDRSNGEGRLLEIREPPGWPFGGGSPRRLLCTTCHAPHGASIETPLLRTASTAAGFCEECHDRSPEYHHRVGQLSDSGCAAQVTALAFGTARGLFCSSCHRAHNAGLGGARESDYVPLLLAPARSGALCERCHPPGNPTCSQRSDYRASHFIGDPTLLETYQDEAPPLRIDPWPESAMVSLYGGEKKQTVTCFSCHTFAKGALVSGDDGTARNLLARSGNPVEWEANGEAVYLCTGCHGAHPATSGGEDKGHTHPTMEADIALKGYKPLAPVTGTPSGKVNCDSCHRPHEAATKGGYYILEAVEGQNTDPLAIHPQIDFTPLCHHCHNEKDY